MAPAAPTRSGGEHEPTASPTRTAADAHAYLRHRIDSAPDHDTRKAFKAAAYRLVEREIVA